MTNNIFLKRDIWHMHDVGYLADGSGYWITHQIATESGRSRDFVAAYIFDTNGNLVDSKIVDLGLRNEQGQMSGKVVKADMRRAYGIKRKLFFRTAKETVRVRPFSVKAFGYDFGLIVRPNEDGDDPEPGLVDAMPGATFLFYEPWEEGRYDT